VGLGAALLNWYAFLDSCAWIAPAAVSAAAINPLWLLPLAVVVVLGATTSGIV
jgi:hypothetical protein